MIIHSILFPNKDNFFRTSKNNTQHFSSNKRLKNTKNSTHTQNGLASQTAGTQKIAQAEIGTSGYKPAKQDCPPSAPYYGPGGGPNGQGSETNPSQTGGTTQTTSGGQVTTSGGSDYWNSG